MAELLAEPLGAKVVSHVCYIPFQTAAMSRQMVADILSLIARMRAPSTPAGVAGAYPRRREKRCASMQPKPRVQYLQRCQVGGSTACWDAEPYRALLRMSWTPKMRQVAKVEPCP